jgi:hypothetical protein
MTKLFIKAQKPSVEKVITAKGVKDNVTVGIKVYSNSEIDTIRKNFQSMLENIKVSRLLREVELVKEDNDLSISETESKLEELYSLIDVYQEEQKDKLHAFYREHVLYLKNASLAYEDDLGKRVDVLVADTREAKDNESLWEKPEKCLPVLLDIFFDSPYYRDSFITTITETILNYSDKEAERKN